MRKDSSLVHVFTQYSKHVGSLNQTVSVNAHARAKGGGEEGIILSLAHERSTEYGLVHETSMWANMRIYCIFESRRDTLAPHASNAQGGPLCKRGGCVRTLRTPPAYGLVPSSCRSNNSVVQV